MAKKNLSNLIAAKTIKVSSVLPVLLVKLYAVAISSFYWLFFLKAGMTERCCFDMQIGCFQSFEILFSFYLLDNSTLNTVNLNNIG